MEIPNTGRAVIDENFDGIQITIPTRKNGFLIPFLCLWLCGWCFGEFFALSTLIGVHTGAGPDLFLLVWVCGWTAGGFFAIRTLCWNLVGKEVISIAQGAITLDKRGAFFYKAKTYDLHEAKNFRAQEENIRYGGLGGMRTDSTFSLKTNGTIKFDYGMETVKFAGGIDEAEANFIIQKLRNKKLIS